MVKQDVLSLKNDLAAVKSELEQPDLSSSDPFKSQMEVSPLFPSVF